MVAAGAAATIYGVRGYIDAVRAADGLRDAAVALRGAGAALPEPRAAQILAVEDPGFYDHKGVDWRTPGAGPATLTQDLARQLAPVRAPSGLPRLHALGYALGLETVLDKADILLLWADRVPMGADAEGQGVVTGLEAAAQAHFAQDVADLADEQFAYLVATIISPQTLPLHLPAPRLEDRAARIGRLWAGQCAPGDHGDVWLEACANAP